MRAPIAIATAALAAAVLAPSCASKKPYRTVYEACEGGADDECCRSSVHHVTSRERPDADYWLTFVELDEKGQLHDPAQLRAAFEPIDRLVAERDFLMVVFVHGWKHNAKHGDGNIRTFHAALAELSRSESSLAAAEERSARAVYGMCIGWRGKSILLPLAKELTFWERKNTAHVVGSGGVTEVLRKLEDVKATRASFAGGPSRTRLVVVGHSFGGAVVYSALSQILVDRWIATDSGDSGAKGPAAGFGDLVVLINPAFEALRYAHLGDLADERNYFRGQRPVLAVLTSEGDKATKYAFPLGRCLSTLFENYRDVTRTNAVTKETRTISQRKADRRAIGHFGAYVTHRLEPDDDAPTPGVEEAVEDASAALRVVQRGWVEGDRASEIRFPGTVLRRQRGAPFNPYLVVTVDEEIIADHNDIDVDDEGGRLLLDFLRYLILFSTDWDEAAAQRLSR